MYEVFHKSGGPGAVFLLLDSWLMKSSITSKGLRHGIVVPLNTQAVLQWCMLVYLLMVVKLRIHLFRSRLGHLCESSKFICNVNLALILRDDDLLALSGMR